MNVPLSGTTSRDEPVDEPARSRVGLEIVNDTEEANMDDEAGEAPKDTM